MSTWEPKLEAWCTIINGGPFDQKIGKLLHAMNPIEAQAGDLSKQNVLWQVRVVLGEHGTTDLWFDQQDLGPPPESLSSVASEAVWKPESGAWCTITKGINKGKVVQIRNKDDTLDGTVWEVLMAENSEQFVQWYKENSLGPPPEYLRPRQPEVTEILTSTNTASSDANSDDHKYDHLYRSLTTINTECLENLIRAAELLEAVQGSIWDDKARAGLEYARKAGYGSPSKFTGEITSSKSREAPVSSPIPLILYCPSCHARHIDQGKQATTEHRTHACQSCGFLWAPAVVPTVGVQFLPGCKESE